MHLKYKYDIKLAQYRDSFKNLCSLITKIGYGSIFFTFDSISGILSKKAKEKKRTTESSNWYTCEPFQ